MHISNAQNNDFAEEIPIYIIQSLAKSLIPEIIAFYESKEGQEYFEKWKAEQDKNKED